MNYYPATIGSEKVTIDGEKVKDKLQLMTSAVCATSLKCQNTANETLDKTSIAVLNGGIYVIPSLYYATDNDHIYFFKNGAWVTAAGNIGSYILGANRAIATYNNQIHLLGGTSNSGTTTQFKHLSYDGSFHTLSNLPIHLVYGAAIEYKGELHIFGGYSPNDTSSSANKHYKWDGATWTFVGTIPFEVDNSGSVVVYNNEIYIFEYIDTSTTVFYKWNEANGWTQISTFPNPHNFLHNTATVYNGELYVLGGQSENFKCYKWDGLIWTEIKFLNDKPYNGGIVVYDGKIHWLGGRSDKNNLEIYLCYAKSVT